ncbi:MAG: hypothetical protein AAGG75_21270 [Bacteroidota bacterium]
MRDFKSLFAILLPCLFLFLTACDKESLETPEEATPQEAFQARVEPGEMIWSYSRDTPSTACGDPDFSVCYTDFDPAIHGDNQSCGIFTIDTGGNLTFNFDRYSLEESILDDLYTTQNFGVQKPIEFTIEEIAPYYTAAGLPVPQASVILRPGDYPVYFEGEIPKGPDYPNPVRGRVVISPDGSDVFYRIWTTE